MAALAIGFVPLPSLVLNDMVPIKGIIPFFDVVANIPSNYVLCDGNNGTPDLNAKFIRGTTVDGEIGLVGGATTHVHDFVGNGHSHDAISTHDCPGSGGIEALSVQPGGEVITNDAASGVTDSGSSIPPLVKMLFIMRLT